MRNPGYVHELAGIYLDGGGDETLALAQRNGVDRPDIDTAARTLQPLSPEQRDAKIHETYVADAQEQGYAYGDPANETTWVLAQRARDHYDPSEQ